MKTQKAGYVFARVPVELMQDIDRAAKERKLSRSDFLREGVEILLRIPTQHFWILKRYAHVKGFLFSGLVREAVERYVREEGQELTKAVQEPPRAPESCEQEVKGLTRRKRPKYVIERRPKLPE